MIIPTPVDVVKYSNNERADRYSATEANLDRESLQLRVSRVGRTGARVSEILTDLD
jgi:hypothetical protein